MAARHHLRDRVDEPDVAGRAGRALELLETRAVELGEIAAQALVTELRPGPESGNDAALAVARLGEPVRRLPRQLHGTRAERVVSFLGEPATRDHRGRPGRSGRAPRRFLFLGPVAEGAAAARRHDGSSGRPRPR
jgi:hypothetical protein